MLEHTILFGQSYALALTHQHPLSLPATILLERKLLGCRQIKAVKIAVFCTDES